MPKLHTGYNEISPKKFVYWNLTEVATILENKYSLWQKYGVRVTSGKVGRYMERLQLPIIRNGPTVYILKDSKIIQRLAKAFRTGEIRRGRQKGS